MGINLKTVPYYNNSGGLDTRSSPTKTPESCASLSLNVDYTKDGAFFTRNGSSILNQSAGIPQQISGAPRILAQYDYHHSDGTEFIFSATADGKIYEGLSSPSSVVSGLTVDLVPDFEMIVTANEEYLIFGNGTDENLKFDGTTWTNLSLPRPTAPTLTDLGVGTLAAGDYYYYVSYANYDSGSGVIIQESQISPISSVLTIGANREIRVTIPVCTETLATGVTAQCNARILYRISPTSTGVAYLHAIIANNTDLTYDDDIAEDGTIEPDFDNIAPPNSSVFESDDFGSLWFRDDERKTDTYTSLPYEPWNCPVDRITIYDAGINCIKRCFGTLITGTERSLWVQNGTFEDSVPRKFSSKIGILNNRCAVGYDTLYITATDFKAYKIYPTDFSQSEMRIDDPISEIIGNYFDGIGGSNSEKVCMEYYTIADAAKVAFAIPFGAPTNNYLLIYNETQSLQVKSPVWQPWNNINASCLKQMTVSGELGLFSGDYNGFLWELDDPVTNGDGAEENGTVTSATATTITDTSQTWLVNEHVGKTFRVLSGDAEGESGVVVSSTSDTLTFSALGTTPTVGAEFTVGGYDTYHFSNWKFVSGSYDTLKQLWFLLANANASGDYPIQLVLQLDFDQSTTNQTIINFTLQSGNALWGDFLWGEGVWGSFSVFQSRYRNNSKFRAIRLGFLNRKAGQPFQINGFSVSSQDKGLFYKAA